MSHEVNKQEKMAKFILDMRKARNLTQKELADQLGVTDKAVSKWERAVSSPDISLLIPLSKALGVSTGELLSGEKDETERTESLVNAALEYSDKSASLRVQRLREFLFAGISAGFLLAAIVCLICNYAVFGELSWSLLVLVSLIFAWSILAPLFKAEAGRVRKSLLVLSVLIFPYLGILSVLLKAPFLRTMGMCIAAAGLLGVWGIYIVLAHVWSSRKYFALCVIFFLLFAEEYGINRIIDGFMGASAENRAFGYLQDVIMLLLSAFCFGISYYKKEKPGHRTTFTEKSSPLKKI